MTIWSHMSWSEARTHRAGFYCDRKKRRNACLPPLLWAHVPRPPCPTCATHRTPSAYGRAGARSAAPPSWTGSSVHSPPTFPTHPLKGLKDHLHRAYGGRTTRSQAGPRASCHRRGRRLSTGTWHLASATAPLPRGTHTRHHLVHSRRIKKDDAGRCSSSRNCLASNDPFRGGASLTPPLPPPPRRPTDQQKPLPYLTSPDARAPPLHGEAAQLLMPRGVGSGAAATNPSGVRRRSPIPRRPIRRRGSSDPPREIRASPRLVLPR